MKGPKSPPLIAASLRGRRRRPSGEPPPLPRHVDPSIRWYLLLAGLAATLWAAMSVPAVLGVITRADLAVLRAVATVRTAWLTHVMLDVDAALTSQWTVRLVAGDDRGARGVPPVSAPRVVPGRRPRRRIAAVRSDAGHRPDAAGRGRDPRPLAGLLAAVAAGRRPGAGAGRRAVHPGARRTMAEPGQVGSRVIVGVVCRPAVPRRRPSHRPAHRADPRLAAGRRRVLAGGPERRRSRSPTGAAARRISTSAAAAERRSSAHWTTSSASR